MFVNMIWKVYIPPKTVYNNIIKPHIYRDFCCEDLENKNDYDFKNVLWNSRWYDRYEIEGVHYLNI
jgi:hypothetical protein